jgi:prevent-host-death family protein
MMEITAKELRTETKRILETVARGEEVVVTYRGKPKAKLIGAQPEPRVDRAGRSPLFGMWRDQPEVRDVNGYVDQLRKKRH